MNVEYMKLKPIKDKAIKIYDLKGNLFGYGRVTGSGFRLIIEKRKKPDGTYKNELKLKLMPRLQLLEEKPQSFYMALDKNKTIIPTPTKHLIHKIMQFTDKKLIETLHNKFIDELQEMGITTDSTEGLKAIAALIKTTTWLQETTTKAKKAKQQS